MGFGLGFGRGGRFASLASLPAWAFGTAAQAGSLKPDCPPAAIPCTPNPAQRDADLIDGFYSALLPQEATVLYREARVPFASTARLDGTGDIVRFDVPAGQTLILTGLDFYADAPDGSTYRFEDGDLRGYLAFALMFDGRAPFDIYSEIDIPGAPPDPSSAVRGSFFGGLGRALGRAGDSPFVTLRAREGTAVRGCYAVLRQPPLAVGHIGAIVRGFLVPSAVLDKKA